MRMRVCVCVYVHFRMSKCVCVVTNSHQNEYIAVWYVLVPAVTGNKMAE